MRFNEIQLLPAFQDSSPSPLMETCVIVPVKDEAGHLQANLLSLLQQIDEQDNRLTFESYEVLVLVNNSTDSSLAIAEEFQKANPSFCLHVASIELPPELAHIGTVRKLLMDQACRRFELLGNHSGIIASIDGDTTADAQWIHHIRQEIASGNDAVGGRIFTSDHAGSAERAFLQDTEYRLLLTEVEHILCPELNDPLPRHFQFFGANMAVTAEYYKKSGGIPLVDVLEDMAFHKALIRCDARIRRSLNVKVTTSPRFDGRVAIGFSEQLKKWSDESQGSVIQIVEDSRLFINFYLLKRQFRNCWLHKNDLFFKMQVKDLAVSLGLSPRLLKSKISSHSFFGACWEEIWQESSLGQNKVKAFEPMHSAIQKLRAFIENPDVTVFQIDPADSYLYADGTNA
ncbi:hypothetical protein A0256_14380 [Mucilaginibacter sp. PAMC 26640]|nr:hypothetical protein A0256_14380 [Mucilaginibacter sp. PAMC 26640]